MTISEQPQTSLYDGLVSRYLNRRISRPIVMIGALAGYGLATLIVLAALTNAVVLLRVVSARRVL